MHAKRGEARGGSETTDATGGTRDDGHAVL